MGLTIMKLNMDQDMDCIDQDSFFLVFLYLSNSYDTLDHGRLLHTLDGYRLGPKLCGIMVDFLENQEVVTS